MIRMLLNLGKALYQTRMESSFKKGNQKLLPIIDRIKNYVSTEWLGINIEQPGKRQKIAEHTRENKISLRINK